MQWGAASRLQRFWDLRAACNFIGGGTGCGLLLWAALGLIAGLPYFPAAGTGLVFVAAGLFMVWLEIGKPWRAFNLFFRPQTSWMTREGIVALPLFAAGAIAVLFDADVRLALNLPSPVIPATLTALLGLTFLYCQLRLMRSAQGPSLARTPGHASARCERPYRGPGTLSAGNRNSGICTDTHGACRIGIDYRPRHRMAQVPVGTVSFGHAQVNDRSADRCERRFFDHRACASRNISCTRFRRAGVGNTAYSTGWHHGSHRRLVPESYFGDQGRLHTKIHHTGRSGSRTERLTAKD